MPATPYSVSKGSFSRKRSSAPRASQIKKRATAAATSVTSAMIPSPTAVCSPRGRPGVLLKPASISSGVGEMMHSRVASPIQGALRQPRSR